MKVITPDNKEKWTSCELRQLIKLMDLRREHQLQLDYYDDEMTEHLSDQMNEYLPTDKQK